MIDRLVAKHNADENNIFLVGWSNGGNMMYRLICEISDRIKAASSFAGVFSNKELLGHVNCINS